MFETILHCFWDAIKDSIITLPILFICYLLIELLEDKILNKYQSSKMLKSKWAPVVSAGFGIIPQCGFSVVATDLYSRKIITIGSLFAIFIATSDEALPLMLESPSNYLSLLIIILVKLVYAIVVGLAIDFVISRKKHKLESNVQQEITLKEDEDKKVLLNSEHVEGCCNHKLEHSHSKLKELFIHPLVHSLKIFLFIVIINFIFTLILAFVGEDVIASFMLSLGFFEPFVVSIIGLIPNCAASVLVAEAFLAHSISIGSCIAGLCVNSGIAIVTLFKLNKNIKENLAILTSLYFLGCFIGVIINLF